MDTSTSLLTPEQASEYLNVSHWTLRNWRYRGEGPPFLKAGRSVRYRLVDLDSWLSGTYSFAS
ncbi:helix-turn-helix domain-containing protein [Streptomyces sp. NPDC058718]|uniref:helix-turn-helix domain-containing protein n=1 Tax=Streptomyces sp. NPDC058718 TaxID=3346610 RepID=UPI0036A42248